jgi:chromosomal replication initiation ATPase DnaA
MLNRRAGAGIAPYVDTAPLPVKSAIASRRAVALALAAEAGEPLGLTAAEVMSRGREPQQAEARKRAYRAARDLGWSYPQIGRAFERDHSTIIQVLQAATRRVRVAL